MNPPDFTSDFLGVCALTLGLWILAWVTCALLHRLGRTPPAVHRHLRQRLRTWAIIIPACIIPIAFGPAGMACGILLLGLACWVEYSTSVGLQRDPAIQVPAIAGLVAASLAVWKQDHQLLIGAAPWVTLSMCLLSLFADRPSGYLRRIGLGLFGFLLCGTSLGHLGFMSGGPWSAALVLWLLLCVELSDVFAFTAGKCFGKTPLCRRTSPNKTRGGLIGSVVLTALFAGITGPWIIGGALPPAVFFSLGVVISLTAGAGDLIVSSIKRDLGIKDLSNALPGHGGFLDRFDSLMLSAPAVSLALRHLVTP